MVETTQSIDLFAIDNPFTDVSLEVTDTTLMDKFGIPLGGAVCNDATESEALLVPDLLKVPNHKITTGGCGTNTSRAVAFSLRKAKFKTKGIVNFGCIGDDEFGTKNEEDCRAAGVTPVFHRIKEAGTSCSGVLVYQKDRSIMVNFDATRKYPTEHLTANIHHLGAADFVFATGYFIDSNAEAIKIVYQLCGQH